MIGRVQTDLFRGGRTSIDTIPSIYQFGKLPSRDIPGAVILVFQQIQNLQRVKSVMQV